MKKPQLNNRVAPLLVRDTLALFRSRAITAEEAARRLALSRSGLYKLYAKYLKASACGGAGSFAPGSSGGDHAPEWPSEVTDALRGWLKSEPRYSFAFAASEALRLFGFRLCRSQVRHWALREGLAKAAPMRPTPFSRRWQR